MIERLTWALYRRHLMRKRTKHFHAHWSSCIDAASQFAGYNRIGKSCLMHRSRLGRFTYLAPGVKLVNATVGAFCSIGPSSQLGGFVKHPTNWISTHPAFYSPLPLANASFVEKPHFEETSPVTIENDVWIGAGAYVLDGCHIGDGAIVAAGAVVTTDVDPYCIVAGVPAKLIRKRFPENLIRTIRASQWWDWPLEKIARKAPQFVSSDILNDESKLQRLFEGE